MCSHYLVLFSPLISFRTETEHIAWFSAGAFVILGFPISIYGIIMHLSNYYQPNIQCYVVRILWMVRKFTVKLIIYYVPFFVLTLLLSYP